MKNPNPQCLSFEEVQQIEEKQHANRMKELEYIRETSRLQHEWEKERMRIKNAEYRRNTERRYWNDQNRK